MKMLSWARQHSWWAVVEALLEQPQMGTLMHVPEPLPEGLSRLINRRTGSFVEFTHCPRSMHILLSADAKVVDAVIETMKRAGTERGPYDHRRDPTELPGFRARGFGSGSVGEA